MLAKHYAKPVVTVAAHATAIEAAQRMRREGVGCLVVTDDEHTVVGVLTDRDLALRVIAASDRDGSVPVRMVMSTPPVMADTTAPVHVVLDLMGRRGVRRVPIVRDGRPIGLLALDDLLGVLSMELHDLAVGSASAAPSSDARESRVGPRGHLRHGGHLGRVDARAERKRQSG